MNRFVTRKSEMLNGSIVYDTVDRLAGVLRTQRIRGTFDKRHKASALAVKLNKDNTASADRIAKEKENA